MNQKNVRQYGRRVFFTIFTQGMLSIAAVIMGFGLPKFLPVEEYSRWQVFYFYVGYVNYLQLGFNDGIILNFSGEKFEELPWRSIKRATIRIVLYLIIGLGIFLVFASRINCDFPVFKLLTFSCIPTVLMCILSAVLLAGNKTYEYNLLCLIIRLTFVAIMIGGIFSSITSAEFYMWADIISKIVIVLIFYLYERQYIPQTSNENIQNTGKFIKENCASGIIIASTVLLLGLLPMCGRVVIQVLGNDIEYAMFSFAISMLSIILTFTNAIGTVAFPMLKNIGEDKDSMQYSLLNKLYDEILWICLWAIVVINIIVSNFLTEYMSVLDYFPILLAICWPLGKIQSIIYPYYKVYRKENEFLKLCILGIIITFGLSFCIYPIAGLMGLAVVALAGVLLTYLLLDMYFEKRVVQNNYKVEIDSYIMLIVFLVTSLKFRTGLFAVIYGGIVLVHLYIVIKSWKKQRVENKKE